MYSRKLRGFTLVELLVVIGIIALLIGILLPVLSRARDSANKISDLANMRSMGQALHMYASAYEASAPFGVECYDPTYTTLLYEYDGSGYLYIRTTWQAQLNAFLAETEDDEIWSTDSAYEPYTQQTRNPIQPYFYNPGRDEILNSIGIAGHPMVMTGPVMASALNMHGSGERAPAKMTRLYSDNAVFWDMSGYNNDHPMDIDPYWSLSSIDFRLVYAQYRSADSISGFARYRDDGLPDPFAGDLLLGNQEPIIVRDREFYTEFDNDDHASSSGAVANWSHNMAQPRFRYGDNTTCNVTFADGSARGLELGRLGSNGLSQTNFTRDMLKIKFPQGEVPE